MLLRFVAIIAGCRFQERSFELDEIWIAPEMITLDVIILIRCYPEVILSLKDKDTEKVIPAAICEKEVE